MRTLNRRAGAANHVKVGIRVPPEVAALLQAEADAQGLSVSAVASDMIDAALEHTTRELDTQGQILRALVDRVVPVADMAAFLDEAAGIRK